MWTFFGNKSYLLNMKLSLSPECEELFGDICDDSFCNDKPETEGSGNVLKN